MVRDKVRISRKYNTILNEGMEYDERWKGHPTWTSPDGIKRLVCVTKSSCDCSQCKETLSDKYDIEWTE